MPERTVWERMRPDWSFETWIRLGWSLTAVFLLIGVVSLLGEILGWWNDLGEIGSTIGMVGGLMLGIATLVLGAGREQATTIRHYVEKNHELAHKNHRVAEKSHELLRSSDSTLDKIQLELDEQTGVLRDIRERL